jgi:ubiquinone biosynthesis protein COQ9
MNETDPADRNFDAALIAAAFRIAGEEGWNKVTVAAAARSAGLSLAEARRRFPGRTALLLRFGQMADAAALEDAPSEGPARDRLFDLLMRRYDALQPHRKGVKRLLRVLPFDPGLALLLHAATQRSMRWMLQAAGVGATGPKGDVQVHGLTAIWYWGLRAWERDESEDLTNVMATLDTALHRADRMASWMRGRQPDVPPPPPAEPGAGELDPSVPPPPDDILPGTDAPPPPGTQPTG